MPKLKRPIKDLKEAGDNMRALDTNVIVFHVLGDSKFGGKASKIIRNIDQGEATLIPLAVLKETLFELLRHGRALPEIIETFKPFQKDNIIIAEDNFSIFLQGLEIADKYKIDPTDGVIVAMMVRHGISEIYSNDPDFDKVPGIKRIF